MSPSVSAGHSSASQSTAPPSGHCVERKKHWIGLSVWATYIPVFMVLSNIWTPAVSFKHKETITHPHCRFNITSSLPFCWHRSITQHWPKRCSWCHLSQTGHSPLGKQNMSSSIEMEASLRCWMCQICPRDRSVTSWQLLVAREKKLYSWTGWQVVTGGCWLLLGKIDCKEGAAQKTSLQLLWLPADW